MLHRMLKVIWKKYWKELLFLAVLLTGFLALISRLSSVGFGLITIGVLFYLYTKLKPVKSNELKSLKQQIINQQNEIANLKNRKLNIAGYKPVLEVSLLQIDTNFTRTWNEKFMENDIDLHFIGALQIHLIAKYGINLQELKIKIDHTNKIISVANLKPKFLSFASINHEWKIAELMEHKKRPWIMRNYWKKSEQYQSLLTQKMEEKRHALYDEVKQGPEEIQWLLKPLYQQMENTMRILLNRTDYAVEFVSKDTTDFVPIEHFFELPLLSPTHEK